MYHLYQGPGPYLMAASSLSFIISHLRNIDWEGCSITLTTKDGIVDVPIVKEWF